MKILHVIGNSEFGGATIYVFSILEKLRSEGHEVSILTSNAETINEANSRGIPVVSNILIVREINPFKDLKALFSIIEYLKREKYDIVHTHTSKGGVIGRIGARLAGVPKIVHTIHGFAFHEFTPWKSKKIFSIIERFAALFGDLMISVNKEDCELAIKEKIVSEKKIKTIYNGINFENNSSLHNIKFLRKEFNIKDSDIVVGVVGRLSEQKGQMYAIKAWEKIIKNNSNIKLFLIGKGPLEKEYKEYVLKSGLSSNVIFTGFRRDISDWLNLVDIFLLPSLWEGLSITLLEAMAMEKVIICTDIKGNREVIQNERNGILVNPKDPEQIAEKILYLIGNEALQKKVRKNALKDYRGNFTEDVMISQIIKVYHNL